MASPVRGSGAEVGRAGRTGSLESSCPPGFSGPDCTFCSWSSAGAACQPGSLRDVFDLQAIKAMTLEELGWTLTDVRHEVGVTVYLADWSGGILQTYEPDGTPIDVPLREAAAFYLPDGYPNTANPGLGLVYAAHYPVNIKPPVAALIARRFGMPVLYHGEYPNWRQAGYSDRAEIFGATGRNLIRANPCYPVDLVRGNFALTLAHTDMLAITLLQRLAEAAGGSVSKVELRGFSKEGLGAWLAFQMDDRIEVGSAGGWQREDVIGSGQFTLDVFGCEPGAQTQALADLQNWYLSTPAGAAYLNRNSVALNLDLLYPRLILFDSDVGMYEMHDGANYMPTGGESGFLDRLTGRPWRYLRKATVEPGAGGEDGDITSTFEVPILGAELLVAGPGAEAALYPRILSATADLTGDSLVVTAVGSANADFARVWWTWSTDLVFNDVDQQPWSSVAMTTAGGVTWTSPPITVPADTVIAWYAEAGNTGAAGGVTLHRNHAAPIRLLRPTAARPCEPSSQSYCNVLVPRHPRRHLHRAP